MLCQSEVKSKRRRVNQKWSPRDLMLIRSEVKEKRGSCAANVAFHNRNAAGESKMTQDMLCFTIETAGRLRSDVFGAVHTVMVVHRWVVLCYWGTQLQIATCRVMVGPRLPEVEMPMGKRRESMDFIWKDCKESSRISKEKWEESKDFKRKVNRK